MNQSTLEAILKYQDTDMRLFEIETELESNEAYRTGARAKQNILAARKRLEDCEKKAQDIINGILRNQQEYESVNAKIAELKQDVRESDADDDIDYIVGVFKKLQDSAAALERDVEDLQRQIQEITRAYNEAREIYKKSKGVFDEKKGEYDAFYASKKAAMDEIKADLDALQKNLPSALVAKYSALRKERKMPVLRELSKDKDGTYRCPRCRMELDAATAEKVRKDGIGECMNCRHILYMK